MRYDKISRIMKISSYYHQCINRFITPLKHEPVFFCLIILFIYLPHFTYEISDILDLNSVSSAYYSFRWIAITMAFPVFFSYLLTWFVCKIHSSIIKYSIIFLTALLALITFFLYFNFSTIISPWILLLLQETNTNEASEFISTYLFTTKNIYVLLILIFIIVLSVIFERRLKRKISLSNYHKSVLFLLVFSFFPVGIFMFGKNIQLTFLRTQYQIEEWRHNLGGYVLPNTITNIIYSMLYLHVSGRDNEKAIKCCLEASKKNATCDNKDSLNIIFIIGESFNKYHASIYGYYLNTTPYMANERQKGNLFVFKDAVSPYNMTTFAVKNILSTNILEEGEPWFGKPAFPIIFKKAGFHVTIWDNQKPDKDVSAYDYALESYMYAPQIVPVAYHEYNSKTYDYDEYLIRSFLLESHKSLRNLHIFHLMGQHSNASKRFPDKKQYKTLKANDIKNNLLNKYQKQTIANYDNATIYNDMIIKKIIDIFSNSSSILVYLSDHGEEVYDYRNFVGRSHEENKTQQALKYQYNIPMVVWCSDKFMKLYPEKTTSIKKAINKPFLSSNISQMLLSLASIKTPFYREDKDILNKQYQCGKRIIQNKKDYDIIMNRK